MTKIVIVAALLALAAAPAGADWGPDPHASTVTTALPPGMTANLMVRPDGAGPAFTAAAAPGGVTVDATVSLTLVGYSGEPYVSYPAEDMWLEDEGGGLTACGHNYGLTADAMTDAAGGTTWSQPPRAGGWSMGAVRVVVSGLPLGSPLPVTFNSPDINGDGQVDLSDAGEFVLDVFGAYARRSDFSNDGILNLTDIGHMAAALGAACE